MATRYPPGFSSATRRLVGTKGPMIYRQDDTTEIDRQIAESTIVDYLRWCREHYPPLTPDQVDRITAVLYAED